MQEKRRLLTLFLSETQVEGEKILIFQLEDGVKKIAQISNINSFVRTKEISEVKELNEEMIYSINEYNPNRIIIEYNGTSNLNELY